MAGSGPDQDFVTEMPLEPNSGRAVVIGDRRPGVLEIPPRLWHGGVSVGGEDAILLYYVTKRYDAKNPDEKRKPWHGFPFIWGPEQK